MLSLPSLASLATLILSALGISDPGIQAAVKVALAAASALVVAVWTHEHHATVRNTDNAVATIKAAAPQTAPAPATPGAGAPAPATVSTTPGAPPTIVTTPAPAATAPVSAAAEHVAL